MEITLKSGDVSAKILSFGAELKSLVVGGRELMWCADPAVWGKTAPVMFPMIGTLKDGKTLIEGKEFSLPKHGFVRDVELTVKSSSPTSVVLSLEQNDYTKQFFPYDFKFSLQYTLKADGITETHRVKNNSNVEMPFCIGGHPAFALNSNLSDYRLEFAKPETAAVPLYDTSKGVFMPDCRTPLLDNATTLPLNHEMFHKDVLYFDKCVSRSVSLLDKDNKGIRVDYPNFTSLGVWQAKDAAFLCIEPWCGSADFNDCTGNFADKQGIASLKPGEEKAFTFSVTAL